VGLAASVPLLLRLRRRFDSWWAPAIGLSLFAVMFALSAFVIGPAISGVNEVANSSVPAVDHENHG
jgi:predicted PurR-regulated permease PerM